MQEASAARVGRTSKYKAQVEYQAQLISQLQEQLDDERKQFNKFVRELRFGVAGPASAVSEQQPQRSPSPQLQSLKQQYALKRQVLEQQREIGILQSRVQEMQMSRSRSDDLEQQLKLSQTRADQQAHENRALTEKLAQAELLNSQVRSSNAPSVAALENRCTELENALQTCQTSAKLSEQQKQELLKRFENLKEVNLQLASRLQECDTEIQRLNSETQNELLEQQQLNQQWQSELETCYQRIRMLESNIQSLNQELQTEQQANDALNQQIAEMQEEIHIRDSQGQQSVQQQKQQEHEPSEKALEAFFKERQEMVNEKDKVISILHSQIQTLQQTNMQLRSDVGRLQTDLLQNRQTKQAELNDSMQFLVTTNVKPALPKPVVSQSHAHQRDAASVPDFAFKPRIESRKSSVREDVKSIDKQINDLLEEKIMPQPTSCGASANCSHSREDVDVEEQKQDNAQVQLQRDVHSTNLQEQTDPQQHQNDCANAQIQNVETSCAGSNAEGGVSKVSILDKTEPTPDQFKSEKKPSVVSPFNQSVESLQEANAQRQQEVVEQWRSWQRKSLPIRQPIIEEHRKPSYAQARVNHDSLLVCPRNDVLEQSGIAKQEVEIVKDDADSVE